MKLSIIIPFVGEYPQILFTIQSVAQSLILPNGEKKIDFEILAVDNYCPEAMKQAEVSAKEILEKLEDDFKDSAFGMVEKPTVESIYNIHKSVYPTYMNRSGGAVEAAAKLWDWLKYIKVDYVLSHWEAKRVACEYATGDVFLFLDSHVVPSGNGIADMFWVYTGENSYEGDGEFSYMDYGSMHMPLTYKILESSRLIYKLWIEGNYFYSYKFTPFRGVHDFPLEVPCMSTCGMMVSKKIYDAIGGWPKKMTMYGGGENFFNFTLSVCGYKKWIYPHCTLFHHGEKRDYHFTYNGTVWNRMIAHYLFGGFDLLDEFTFICKGDKKLLLQMSESIKADISLYDHRQIIAANQEMRIDQWVKNWNSKGDK